MKSRKFDSVYNVLSNQYINATTSFHRHLAFLIRSFFAHGYIPENLLVCSLYPLIKDNFGDSTKSSNYRAIAGGCLLLKLVDLIVIMLESEKLSSDELQFAYEEKSSTIMCSLSLTTGGVLQ